MQQQRPSTAFKKKKKGEESQLIAGTFLVVRWLRLRTRISGGPGPISGQKTRSHMRHQRPSTGKELNESESVSHSVLSDSLYK